jgi:integrase
MTNSSQTQQPEKRARALPPSHWPDADRNAWQAACQPAARLKRGGSAGHLKPVTREDHARHYGLFLAFLFQCGLLRSDGTPAANVTPEKVDAYVAYLKKHVGSVTVHGSICKLRRAARYMGSAQDFTWLSDIAKDLALEMRPRSKFDRLVLVERLVTAGLSVVYDAERSQTLTALARAHQIRNGLMVALLAFCPIRLKNFAGLEIGRSFVKLHGTWWIVLSASETKERRADERPVNELLTPILDRYLDQHRPVLARSNQLATALWLSANHCGPINDKQVAHSIRATTLAKLGVAVSPHLFRMCAASTAAMRHGENPHLASALLHHTHPNVTNAHYNRATSLSAAENFRQVVRQYEKS